MNQGKASEMLAYLARERNKTTQVAGTPPLPNVGFKNILVETFNNIGHPTRCPQPLNSVRLMMSFIVQGLHNVFFKPTLCKGGVPATCEARLEKYEK